MAKTCAKCGKRSYNEYCFNCKPKKRLPQQSKKEISYQVWKETVARPWLIKMFGNICACCGRPARPGEKLDIDHKKNKGSHTALKKVLSNMQLLCRFPCHSIKTDNKECKHL